MLSKDCTRRDHIIQNKAEETHLLPEPAELMTSISWSQYTANRRISKEIFGSLVMNSHHSLLHIHQAPL